MKGNIISLLTFFIVIASKAQNSSIDSLALNWKHYKLKNGIQVILQPDATQKEITVEFWVRMGARDERKGKFGFAHFFEHATPYGLTKDTASSNALRSARTNSNAQTRKDYTRYFVQVKPAGLELALRYSADRLRADTSAIADTTTEKHRRNVLNEMNRQETSPFYGPTATGTREAATFGKDHPYGHSTYGTIKENESFTSDEIKTWYEQYFFTDNIVLFVVGNFDAEKIIPLIEKEFAGISRKGTPTKVQKSSPKTIPQNISAVIPSASHFLSLGWIIPAFGSKDDPALQILAQVVEARLVQPLQSSITKAGAMDMFNLYQWSGQFGVFASFSSLADSNKVEDHLYNTIQDIIQHGVSEEELQKAKLKAIESVKEMYKELGFIESRTELLGESLLYTNKPDYYLQRLQKQSKLTTRDIQNVAISWIKNKAVRVLLISSKQQ